MSWTITDIDTFREGMRVTKDYCFLNHASNGPLHEDVLQKLHEVVDSQKYGL